MAIDAMIDRFRATGCAYAIDGKQGGRLLSPLQQVDYRDFAANPQDWGTSWADAIGANEGWEVNITCRYDATGNNPIMFGRSYGRFMIKPYANSIVVTFYCFEFSTPPTWVLESAFSGKVTSNVNDNSAYLNFTNAVFPPGVFHTLRLVCGETTATVYLDNQLVATCTGTVTYDLPFVSLSSDGNIQSITLKNSTSTTVWQAPQSELYSGWLLKPLSQMPGGATFEIKQGLIKLSSTVSTNTQGQFVASAAAGEITTPIDLRGYNGDFSIMWDGNDTLTRVTLLQGNGTTLQSPIVFSGDATRIFITISNGTVSSGVAVNCPQGTHRVILVCNRTSNTLTLYVDDLSPSNTAIPDDFGALYDAAGYDNLRVRPSTYLARFAFWNRALSAEEVATL